MYRTYRRGYLRPPATPAAKGKYPARRSSKIARHPTTHSPRKRISHPEQSHSAVRPGRTKATPRPHHRPSASTQVPTYPKWWSRVALKVTLPPALSSTSSKGSFSNCHRAMAGGNRVFWVWCVRRSPLFLSGDIERPSQDINAVDDFISQLTTT